MSTNTAEQEVSPSDELFLVHLETSKSIRAAAEAAGMTPAKGYAAVKRLKDTIVSRARDNMAGHLLRAVGTVGDLLGATADTEKGELRLKAAEGILDRTGLTKHTNVDVQVESHHGIFILPAKASIDPDTSADSED